MMGDLLSEYSDGHSIYYDDGAVVDVEDIPDVTPRVESVMRATAVNPLLQRGDIGRTTRRARGYIPSDYDVSHAYGAEREQWYQHSSKRLLHMHRGDDGPRILAHHAPVRRPLSAQVPKKDFIRMNIRSQAAGCTTAQDVSDFRGTQRISYKSAKGSGMSPQKALKCALPSDGNASHTYGQSTNRDQSMKDLLQGSYQYDWINARIELSPSRMTSTASSIASGHTYGPRRPRSAVPWHTQTERVSTGVSTMRAEYSPQRSPTRPGSPGSTASRRVSPFKRNYVRTPNGRSMPPMPLEKWKGY